MPQTRDRLDRALLAWRADPLRADPRLLIALRTLTAEQREVLAAHLTDATIEAKADALGLPRREFYEQVARLKCRLQGALAVLAETRAA